MEKIFDLQETAIETPKSPAQLWYKIHVFYVDRTSKTTSRRKSVGPAEGAGVTTTNAKH